MSTKENLVGCKCGDNVLDVGCGKETFRPGVDGFDIVDCGQKYIGDIEKTWPIPDNTYDFIHAWNIFEHLRNKLFVMNEAQRVLKPGGIIEILVPDIAKKIDLAVADPTHVSFWVKGTFNDYFCGKRPGGAKYDMKKWELVECRNYDEVSDNLIIVHMRKPNEQNKLS